VLGLIFAEIGSGAQQNEIRSVALLRCVLGRERLYPAEPRSMCLSMAWWNARSGECVGKREQLVTKSLDYDDSEQTRW
jgi:hypothetical protein